MRGLLLAGGSGTRMYPLTLAVNKHLLPIATKPMIYYSIVNFMLAGVNDIGIVVNPAEKEAFQKLFGNGSNFGVKITYINQTRPGGIVDAIKCADAFLKDQSFLLILGDNLIFGESWTAKLKLTIESLDNSAVCFVKKVLDPSQLGVLVIENDRATKIVEKPNSFISDQAIIGLYAFPSGYRTKLHEVNPSERGEYEITSFLSAYLEDNRLEYRKLGRGTIWYDLGNLEDYIEANRFVDGIEAAGQFKLACLEEVALQNEWITAKNVQSRLKSHKSNSYTDYVLSFCK